ncbi:lipocalin family protein [Dysgonomonas sp. BGC7]|uniref:lipocalin family protein n=1 Tax=Dysgonomonas sp. BGC7 TaxID=1658008 RepID=UPI000680FEC7|nr:lipocalin family protein [Dysgonomonas sp. BGC7]MBD8387467.1 lipocalin family protein [Dysgonomonas sp. BGC7]
MKKLFLLLLLTPFLFAACSSDDDGSNDSMAVIKVESEVVSYNTIKLSWPKILNAYRYQVFFKAEGGAEWQNSNSIMPVDQSTSVIFEQSYFTPDTKYTIVVKAFRDSGSGSIIGESEEFVLKTFKPNEENIIGTWDFVSFDPIVTASSDEIKKAVEKAVNNDIDFFDYITFSEDGKISDSGSEKNGSYSLYGNSLTVTYLDGGKEYTDVADISMSENRLIIYTDDTEAYIEEFPGVSKVIVKSTYERRESPAN